MNKMITKILEAMIEENMIDLNASYEIVLESDGGEESIIDGILEVRGACQHTHVKAPLFSKAYDEYCKSKYSF